MGNIISSGQAAFKAGANYSGSAISEDAWNMWISGAEATVNSATRKNWSDSFATLNDDAKHIVADTVASLAAIDAVKHDMSGFSSRIEAEDMINVLRDAALRNISFLRDIKTQTFIDGA